MHHMTNENSLGDARIYSCQMRVDLLFFATSGLGGKSLTVHRGNLLTFWWGEHIPDERGNRSVVHPRIIPVGRRRVLAVI